MFGIYALERLFDTASTAVIAALALLFVNSQSGSGETTSALGAAAKTANTLLFAGVTAAVVFLVYLRVHETAVLEKRLQGWRQGQGWRRSVAGILLGFVRGVQAIRDVKELLLAIFYSGSHWFLVLLIYYWGTHSFANASPRIAELSLGQVMLVMAFSLVGSVVQLPAIGGGAQLASVLVYTKIFGVETEPATAGAVVVCVVWVSRILPAGRPFLFTVGFVAG